MSKTAVYGMEMTALPLINYYSATSVTQSYTVKLPAFSIVAIISSFVIPVESKETENP